MTICSAWNWFKCGRPATEAAETTMHTVVTQNTQAVRRRCLLPTPESALFACHNKQQYLQTVRHGPRTVFTASRSAWGGGDGVTAADRNTACLLNPKPSPHLARGSSSIFCLPEVGKPSVLCLYVYIYMYVCIYIYIYSMIIVCL